MLDRVYKSIAERYMNESDDAIINIGRSGNIYVASTDREFQITGYFRQKPLFNGRYFVSQTPEFGLYYHSKFFANDKNQFKQLKELSILYTNINLFDTMRYIYQNKLESCF